MHQEILKLISLVRESGELTAKHKEIIISKAEKLGDNLEEVEMMLDTIKQKDHPTSTQPNKREIITKCPNCGAVISETSFQCPECGFVLSKETVSSQDTTESLTGLQDKLLAIDKIFSQEQASRKKASLINSYPIPNTIEALIRLLHLSYSNYEASKGVGDKRTSAAWLGKAIESYRRLSDKKDIAAVASVLERYKQLGDKKAFEKLSGSHKKKKFRIISITALLLLVIGVLFTINHSKASAEKLIAEFEQSVEQGNLVNAELAIKKIKKTPEKYIKGYSLRDVSATLKKGLHSNYCSGKPEKADTLLNYILSLPEEFRFDSKEEFWEYIRIVSEYHIECNDYNGFMDVLNLYHQVYGSDYSLMSYTQQNIILILIRSGAVEEVKQNIERLPLMFGSAPENYYELVKQKVKTILKQNRDYVMIGYSYANDTNEVISIIPGSSADRQGVRVGDVLVENGNLPRKDSDRRIACDTGETFKHTFKRGNQVYEVDLKYEKYTFPELKTDW